MVRRKKAPLPPLGDLEEAVLGRLQQVSEADVRELHDAVGKGRGISLNTVGSAAERLHRKGLVGRRKVSHAFRYRPLLSREELDARRLAAAVGGARTLAQEGLLAAFVDLVADVDDEALDHLEVLIARRREENSG